MTLTPELLAELQSVDSDWRLIPCDGLKRPVDPDTGDIKTDWSHHTYDADGIAELADSSFVKAVGLVLGEASGVIAVDFDGTGAVAMFKQVYGRIWSDLPPTVAWSSGSINRRQMAFRVPADLWPHLRGRRVWHNDAGRIVLELRGTGHQSVIAGAHPDTEGYRWIDGRSPADLQVADAPDWLLWPMLKAATEPAAAEHQPTSDADVPRAQELLKHIPPCEDYDRWLRVGMALHSVSAGLISDWVDWSRGCSNFDEEECMAKWQSFKSSGTTIGTLHYLADTLGGFRYRRPQGEQPPGKASGAAADAGAADVDEQPPASYRELLAVTLAAIRDQDDDTEMEARAEIMARFRRTDGQINAALFRLLTEQEQHRAGTAPKERPTYRSIDLSKVISLDWLLEGFLPANDQALLYAPAGAGKTTAALAMAFAIIDGTGFLDREAQPQAGSVLMIATDSGPAPLIRTLQDLGKAEHPAISPTHEGLRLHVWAHDTDQAALGWEASLRGCLGLLDFVRSEKIALVIIDSCKAATSRADLNYCDNGQVTALLTFVKEVICQHCSVLWLNHDGTAGGEAAGAKAWKEVPSIVHSIQPVMEGGDDDGFEGPPDKSAGKKRVSTWRRTWAVRKCRQGTAREFNYQIDEDTGRLAVTAMTEVIRDVRHGVGKLLWEALQGGKPSLHRREIIAQLGKAKGYSSGSVANSLTRASGGRRPMVARVGPMPGHWKLTPVAREWFERHGDQPMPP
jgi:hypothetical protein